MNNKKLAEEILNLVGGKENISNITHCVTRLRLTLNDNTKIKEDEIKKLKGVLGTQTVGSQYQIILGGIVIPVFEEISELTSGAEKKQSNAVKSENKEGIVTKFLDTLSGIFVPVIPAIIGAGLLKAILLGLMFQGLVNPESELFSILNIFSDAGFYFLPILLAVSASNKFKTNPYIGATIAGILIHPQLISLMGESKSLNFLGIPFTSVSYGGSVIPIVLGILFMSYVEKGLNKVILKILKTILLPLLTLLITAPVILAVIGPVGQMVGNAIGNGFIKLYMSPLSWLAGGIFGALFPYLVMVGMHNGFAPIMIQTLSTYGVDYIMGLNTSSNSAQAGATFAVFLKTKNIEFKSLSGMAAFNAILGITEPALYGVTSRLKKPLLAVSLGGAVGGMISGFFRVEALGMATGPIIGIPLFIGPTFKYFVLASIVSFIVGFVATIVIGFDDIPENV
ncbi:MAG: PTS transporter subunit EIIC [Erysipelotrichaceae bacterium]|nr:PTS transporter subunit EIIC [Erysipelotrichaceae bacterium]